MGGCCSRLVGKKHTLEGDIDVVDTAAVYEAASSELVFPIWHAWVKSIGCTAQRRVCGTEILINVREEKDGLKVTYGPHHIPLHKLNPKELKEDDLQIESAKIRCKITEYTYSFVAGITHVWQLWTPLDDMVSPDLPVRIIHTLKQKGSKDHGDGASEKQPTMTSWTQTSLKDVIAENFQCRSYLEVTWFGEVEKFRRTAFLSGQAPGWVIQLSARSELCVEYHANPDLSWDAFPVTVFKEDEYSMFLAHLTP
eukprot:PhF_6_TR11202/c0_g1_i1/m.18061